MLTETIIAEAIIAATAEAVIGYALKQSGLTDRVRTALGRDPAKTALATAIRGALDASQRAHPDATDQLFDASFMQHEAAPVLAQLLYRRGDPSADALAGAWADSLGLTDERRQRGLAQMTPVAAIFLAALEEQASREEALQTIFDRRAREQTARNTASTAQQTSVLPEIRDRIVEMAERLSGQPAPRPDLPLRTALPPRRVERLAGRDEDLAWTCQRLRQGDVAALASLQGIGGIGKTELANLVARTLADDFGGRIVWIECGPNDVLAIQERMAAALGAQLHERDPAIRGDALHRAWQGQPPTLVVLDDLRRAHLPHLGHLRPPQPPCALLITSRRYNLPLPVGTIRSLDLLSDEEAGAALADQISPEVLAQEPEALAGALGLLGGIPLAIHLAANRARAILKWEKERPLAGLLAELQERRLQVLNQGEDPQRPDLSVVVTFDISYRELDPPDQARLRRLGVFARNHFDLAGAGAVWEEEPESARLALARLTNAGLVEETAQDG